MKLANVYIESLASVEAPEVVTSEALEAELGPAYARLGIPPRCVEALTGIVARRFWPVGREVSDVATEAARKALAAANVKSTDIGLCISTSVSKEYLEPSVAAMVHGKLGLPSEALNFDLSNACLGFLSAMGIAGKLIESGEIKAALIVAGESSRSVVKATAKRLLDPSSTMADYKSALPTLTLGSGAVAMVLVHESMRSTEHRFDGIVSLAATEHHEICVGTNEWMRTDAPKLLVEGIALARRVFAETKKEFGWNDDNIAQYICHQVGAAHLATLSEKLEISIEKAFKSYPDFGNMGAVALPFTLDKAVSSGAIRSGDTVSLMGIGSGLNCSMGKVTW